MGSAASGGSFTNHMKQMSKDIKNGAIKEVSETRESGTTRVSPKRPVKPGSRQGPKPVNRYKMGVNLSK